VINPAVLAAGTELSFGYFPQERSLAETTIDANAYTCTSSPPGF
jgi:YD repeat-containing protein